MILQYKDLQVWQKAYQLSILVYGATNDFPKAELFGMVSQIRRAAVSIVSNIAEGNGRGHAKEYVQFLKISLGSLAELETQILISADLGYISRDKQEEILKLSKEVGKMLSGLIRSLRKTEK